MKRVPRVLIVFLALLVCVSGLFAQETGPGFETTRQIVFGLAPFDGGRYLATFAPESRDTIYLTAGHQHVVTVNMSDVYYWPITAEYRADFQGFNRQLPGQLRVYRGDDLVETLEQRRFIYLFPHGPQGEATRLLFDAEMEGFIADRALAVEDYQAGRRADVPAAGYQGPFEGFILRLEEGRYRLSYRIEREGEEFSLNKELVVFTDLAEGIHYEIIPEDKWTISSASDSPHARLYLKHGQVVYLKSFPASLYNHALYDLMASPQKPMAGMGLESSARWVAGERSLEEEPSAALDLTAAGQRVRIRPRDYLVRQAPGSALGYQIVEYSAEDYPGRRPSFRAYRIEAPPAGVSVQLLSAARPLTSARVVRTVDPTNLRYTAGAMLLPLILVALRLVVDRRERRHPHEKAE